MNFDFPVRIRVRENFAMVCWLHALSLIAFQLMPNLIVADELVDSLPKIGHKSVVSPLVSKPNILFIAIDDQNEWIG